MKCTAPEKLHKNLTFCNGVTRLQMTAWQWEAISRNNLRHLGRRANSSTDPSTTSALENGITGAVVPCLAKMGWRMAMGKESKELLLPLLLSVAVSCSPISLRCPSSHSAHSSYGTEKTSDNNKRTCTGHVQDMYRTHAHTGHMQGRD